MRTYTILLDPDPEAGGYTVMVPRRVRGQPSPGQPGGEDDRDAHGWPGTRPAEGRCPAGSLV